MELLTLQAPTRFLTALALAGALGVALQADVAGGAPAEQEKTGSIDKTATAKDKPTTASKDKPAATKDKAAGKDKAAAKEKDKAASKDKDKSKAAKAKTPE